MCAILANALADRGYHVIIVSTDKPNSQDVQFNVSSKIKCYTLKGNRIERKLSRMKFTSKYPFFKYKSILIRHHIQLIVDVDVHLSLITTKVVSKDKVRIVSWDHFNYERYLAKPSHIPLHECFLNSIDKLVVLTKSDMRDYIEKEKLPLSLVTQIYNPSPIENDTFIKHESHKVLAIGRLEEQKGFDLLLDAWKIIEANGCDWQLEIVGDGNLREKLELQSCKLGLKQVVFSPFSQDVRTKYEKASIFVLSSRYEGFGLVLIEANSMSLPLVSFDCKYGPSEIIQNGENGFLVPANDTKAMASKILALVNDDHLREEMGRKGFFMSQKYRVDNIVKQWIDLFESL